MLKIQDVALTKQSTRKQKQKLVSRLTFEAKLNTDQGQRNSYERVSLNRGNDQAECQRLRYVRVNGKVKVFFSQKDRNSFIYLTFLTSQPSKTIIYARSYSCM